MLKDEGRSPPEILTSSLKETTTYSKNWDLCIFFKNIYYYYYYDNYYYYFFFVYLIVTKKWS